jgi:hypothetical protein
MVWPAFGLGRPALRLALVAGLALTVGCDSSGTVGREEADAVGDTRGVSDVATTDQDSGDAATAPAEASPDSQVTDAAEASADAADAGDADAGMLQDAPLDAEPHADADTSTVQDADAGDSAIAPQDSGNDADAADATLAQDSSVGMDSGVDATLHDGAPSDAPLLQDSGPDAADAADAAVDSGTITCTTTRQVAFPGGCVPSVMVEKDVGLFPVNLPSLGWAGGLGTNSSGISQLYTNNSVPDPSQQLFLATDKTLAVYVGYTMVAGDGGPNDWGTALRTDSEITSFTLNAVRQGALPPNCNIPEIAVQCSGATTLGCQWYGQACGVASAACCPDSIFTPIGDAGPWPVTCTANLCCNPSASECNTGAACCSGTCSGDAGSAGRRCQ